ncbi:MAG: IS1634 family transposase [Phycisphaerae bacterium]|nr:IS1634 family transposase [Desulfuromonadales bacterium]NIR47090.1 IS1634 family transposase [candidate division KSB1 bacterium]NIU55928.1 IS1634 family transposase [Phycisphaerae bacterium]NIS22685.1 IS1634 family transposase [candidate division KSB1 bacterium]NIT69533.1 IS1634 family transposase [candidate division KSB1 bacterium]
MYIRTISRKNKDGSKVTYVQLAHNERDPEKGHSKAKVLYSFGRLEHLDIEQLKRLVKSISRFLPAENALEAQALLRSRGRPFKWKCSCSFGGIYLLSALWQRLHFHKLIEERVAHREFRTPIAQAVFAMVANRCLAPTSKLATSEWVEKDVFIPDLPKIDVQVLYRAMDFLLSHQAELEQQIYWSVADLLNLEVDLVFFDTTSTYFETESESDLKKRGYSKDKRGDLPQVVIGLAVTRQGIPVKHWMFPGNTVDMSTIERVKDDLAGWRLNRCVVVHDSGMSSETNLQYLQRGGGHYIVGRKLKSGEADVEEALGQKGRYTQIEDQLWAKEVVIGEGEKRKRLVLVKNDKEQRRAEQNRQTLIQTLEAKLAELGGKTQTKAASELKAHRIYGKYLKAHKDSSLHLDHAKLKEESRYDGKYLIETSDDTLSLRDIVLGYKQLYDVEHAFRTLKTTLELRPNHHSKDERIRCHIFLCFIALVLVRIVEHESGERWPKVRREMHRLFYGEFEIDSKHVAQLTELTREQRSILKSLNIKEPSTIVDIQDV